MIKIGNVEEWNNMPEAPDEERAYTEFVQMQKPGYPLRYNEISGDQLAAIFQGYGVGSAIMDDEDLVDSLIGYIVARMDLSKPLSHGSNRNNFRRILYLEEVSSNDGDVRMKLIEGLREHRAIRRSSEN